MSDAIRPALTPEEWKAMLADDEFPSGLMPLHILIGVAIRGQSTNDYSFKMVATFNAALPDDDPRKITREDVHNVEDAIGTIMMGVRVETLSVQGLWDLAAKLAALLPPSP